VLCEDGPLRLLNRQYLVPIEQASVASHRVAAQPPSRSSSLESAEDEHLVFDRVAAYQYRDRRPRRRLPPGSGGRGSPAAQAARSEPVTASPRRRRRRRRPDPGAGRRPSLALAGSRSGREYAALLKLKLELEACWALLCGPRRYRPSPAHRKQVRWCSRAAAVRASRSPVLSWSRNASCRPLRRRGSSPSRAGRRAPSPRGDASPRAGGRPLARPGRSSGAASRVERCGERAGASSRTRCVCRPAAASPQSGPASYCASAHSSSSAWTNACGRLPRS